MDRYSKLGYEGIELELPVHALFLYRESEQLLSTIIPLIAEGNERKEKCIFIGKEKDCRSLKKKFKKQIITMSKGIGAADFRVRLRLVRRDWLKRRTQRAHRRGLGGIRG